ncbi:hypothetical protein DIPPA_25712 [Diplonema papillatum]|nr:hypothetical protein DIPPA_25712 [Diplonema papillatum]
MTTISEEDYAKWSKADWQKTMVDDTGFQFEFVAPEEGATALTTQMQAVKPSDDADGETQAQLCEKEPENLRRILKVALKTLPDTFCKNTETAEALEDWKQKKRSWKKAKASHKRFADSDTAPQTKRKKAAKE